MSEHDMRGGWFVAAYLLGLSGLAVSALLAILRTRTTRRLTAAEADDLDLRLKSGSPNWKVKALAMAPAAAAVILPPSLGRHVPPWIALTLPWVLVLPFALYVARKSQRELRAETAVRSLPPRHHH